MAEKPPLISIITPLYNTDQFVGACIESILAQTISDFEWIIIDDCSTDTSVAVVQSYLARDSRIQLLRNDQNLGAAASRNRGLDIARGEFIAFMDSDDLSVPERFAHQLDYLRQHPDIDLCGSYYTEFTATNSCQKQLSVPLTHEMITITMLFGCPFISASVMIRSAPFQRSKVRFRPGIAEDFQLWVDLAPHMRMGNLPEYLYLYRRWELQLSTHSLEQQTDCAQVIQRQQLSDKFGLELSDEQAHVYSRLTLQIGTPNHAQLQIYRHLLQQIYRANLQRGCYNPKMLKRQLLRRYKMACSHLYPMWIAKIKKRFLAFEL